MLFEPYYALSIEKDKKGNDIPSKKYESLHNPVNGYKKGEADKFLEEFFSTDIYEPGYIKRLRTCYNKVTRELNEVVKTAVTGLAITATSSRCWRGSALRCPCRRSTRVRTCRASLKSLYRGAGSLWLSRRWSRCSRRHLTTCRRSRPRWR